jgi:hypothetical protein
LQQGIQAAAATKILCLPAPALSGSH